MKIKSLILFIIFAVFFISCEKDMKWINPNDATMDQAEVDKICKTSGYECGTTIASYQGVAFEINCGKCSDGYTCTDNKCEKIDSDDTDKTDTASDNDDEKPVSDDEDSGDSVTDDDSDSTDTMPDNSDSATDNDTDTDSGDSTPDADSDNQESGFDQDSQGIWVDPKPFTGTVHLMWENPMGNTGVGGTGISHANAETYCNNLVLAGHDDWRLPTIDELRTLVRGVSTTMTGGKCPTSESCTDQDSCNKDKDNSKGFGNSCLGCVALDTSTYDPAISYLDFDNDCQLSSTQLANNECYIVKAMHGDPCNGTWSSTKNTSIVATLTQAYYYLNYVNGQINSGSDTMSTTPWVRCVRQGTAADVTEEEEEAGDPSQNWECTADTDCTGGKTCRNHKCVTETYVAANGLEWQRGRIIEILNKWEEDVIRIEGWDAAKTYCENLDYAGHNDWRLPNLTELKSLVQGCAATNECPVTAENPSYPDNYSSVCKICASGNYMPAELGLKIDFNYWSSTEDPTASKHVWSIDFKTVAVFNDYKTANLYAMCVRSK